MGENRLIIAAGIAVAAIVLLIVAYALVQVPGVFGDRPGVAMPVSPTPTPVPKPAEQATATPTMAANPAPVATARPATPVPTAVPAKMCPVHTLIDMDFSLRLYSMRMNLTRGADPADMSKVMISVTTPGGSQVYQNITYDQWVIANRARWSNADGDTLLEPGEIITWDISGFTLGIPADAQVGVAVFLDSEEIRRFSLPAMTTGATIPPFTWDGTYPR
jgi:hypothetical protein